MADHEIPLDASIRYVAALIQRVQALGLSRLASTMIQYQSAIAHNTDPIVEKLVEHDILLSEETLSLRSQCSIKINVT